MAAPVNFQNTAQSESSLTFTWTASATSGVTAKLYFTPAMGSELSTTLTSGYPVEGFSGSTIYNTQMVFIKNGVESDRSTVVSATTQAAQTQVPPQMNFNHVASDTSINLSWNAVTGSGYLTYFVVY